MLQYRTRMGMWMVAALACSGASFAAEERPAPPEPTLAVEPQGEQLGRWRLLVAEIVRITVTAPGAERVRLIYRPFEAVDRHIDLTTVEAPPEDQIVIEWNTGTDLAGDVWAEVDYPGGDKAKTESLALAHADAVRENPAEIPLDSVGGSVDSEASSRSDKLTGGEIERTELAPGDSRIWITVDVPAFRLTLWQTARR